MVSTCLTTHKGKNYWVAASSRCFTIKTQRGTNSPGSVLVLDQLSSPPVIGLSSSTESSVFTQLLSPEHISAFSSLLCLTGRALSCLCAAAKMWICSVTRSAADTLPKECHWHILFPKQTGPTCHIGAKCQVVSTCKTVVRNESSAVGNPQTLASTSSVPHASMKKAKCKFPSPRAQHSQVDPVENVPIQPATWNVPERERERSLSPPWAQIDRVSPRAKETVENVATPSDAGGNPWRASPLRGIPQCKWVFN